jgi:hypothetical protein
LRPFADETKTFTEKTCTEKLWKLCASLSSATMLMRPHLRLITTVIFRSHPLITTCRAKWQIHGLIPMASSVATSYAANVAAGRIERDDAQLTIVEKMTRLEARISEYRVARKSSALDWLFTGPERAQSPIKAFIFMARSVAAKRC